MAHPRKRLRQMVKQILTDAGTAAGAHVFSSRTREIPQTKLPAIVIYTPDEESESLGGDGGVQSRVVELVIEAGRMGGDDLDDDLDDLAEQIESALKADRNLGGSADNHELTKTSVTIDESGERPIGAVRMIYRVTLES